MIIRFFIVLLGLCGWGIILCGLVETIFCSGISDVYHVIPLHGGCGSVEQTVRKALHSLKGRLYFVDLELSPEEQMSVELLLRECSYAKLCAPEQILQELRWENDFGTGTDQRNGHHSDFPE